MNEPKRGIVTNAFHYVAGQGAMAIFGLVSSIVLARQLPKPVFGQYSFLLALVILFLPLLDLGGHTYYAVLGSRDRSAIGTSWARALALKLRAVPLVIALLALYFWLTAHTIGGLFVLVCIYTVTQSLFLSTDVVFKPAEEGAAWAIRRSIYELGSFLLILVGLFCFGVDSVIPLLMLSALALGIATIWAMRAASRSAGMSWLLAVDLLRRPFRGDELKPLIPFALNTTLWVLYYRETNLLLENFGTRAGLADYRVAFLVMTAALYLPKALIWASIPRIAYYEAQLDQVNFQRVLSQTVKVNTYLSVLITTGGLLFGAHLIALAFGPKYSRMGITWTLFDLVLGLLFIQQFCMDLLNALHREQTVVFGLIGGIAILTVLSALLIPHSGTLGAAMAQLAACALMVPINLVAVRRRTGLSCLPPLLLLKLVAAAAMSAIVSVPMMHFSLAMAIGLFLLTFAVSSYFVDAMPEQFHSLAGRLMRTPVRQTD